MAANSGSSSQKVKLISANNNSRRVTFRATPQVIENRNVNYNALEPLHAPGQIQVYKNTASRNFNISDLRLVSRTREEADANLKILWTLRAWCLPRFGNSSTLSDDQRLVRSDPDTYGRRDEVGNDDFPDGATGFQNYFGTELLGAPPEILLFSAYSLGVPSQSAKGEDRPGTKVWQIAQHLNRVPVVIQQLSIPYPNDVDYITTSRGVPMPIIMNLDISLIETHSPNAYEAFSLDDYRRGVLKGF